jgi:pyruvate dehydrogenase E1 component alpha subunit
MHSIEDLSNPKKFNQPLEVGEFKHSFLMELLEIMLIIRTSEEKLAEQRELEKIGGPVHLSAGQEAMAVGIAKNLRNTDRVFGAHRSHSHLLSLNPNPYKLFAEVLGRETGFSKGMGGSMHLIDKDSGFYGSVPIVSGTVPLAVGAAFDSSRQGKDDIGVAFIGDGATEEGIVHESLNLAKVLPAPTLFVVENNLFSSHMHISLRQPTSSTCRYAKANEIENILIDGNDVLEIFASSKHLIEKSRATNQPCYIEGLTFRHYGHVDWRKDIDVGVSRSGKDIDDWMKRDPIKRLFLGMKEASIISLKDFEDLSSKTSEMIENSWLQATKDPYPALDELLRRVYSNEN